MTALVPISPPLSTAAWYGDRLLELGLPADWEVTVHLPATPDPLTDDAIRDALRAPVGQSELATLAAGRRRVAIVVDDLTRPTPVDRILPRVVDELARAGVQDAAITVLIGTGTHGPSRAGPERKVGSELARRLRIEIHDDRRGCVRVGTTSFGSPVVANRRVVEADLVIGIGGIYPQHTVGFGGGAKIVLGVLGRRSIERLHFRHEGVGGRHDLVSSFRQDVTEMATMVGLEVSIGAMVDARRQLVWLRSGDPGQYFADACAEAIRRFGAPMPGDADVVISNAYPMDLSATFVRSKGIVPLVHAKAGASRVLIGAASEGLGHHGLFPLVSGRGAGIRQILRTARNVPRMDVPRLAARRIVHAARRVGASSRRPEATGGLRPVLFHPTGGVSLPEMLAGMQTEASWERIIGIVEREQAGMAPIRAVVYPCSPLQVLED